MANDCLPFYLHTAASIASECSVHAQGCLAADPTKNSLPPATSAGPTPCRVIPPLPTFPSECQCDCTANPAVSPGDKGNLRSTALPVQQPAAKGLPQEQRRRPLHVNYIKAITAASVHVSKPQSFRCYSRHHTVIIVGTADPNKPMIAL